MREPVEDLVERAQRNAYYEIGLELRAIRDGGRYKIEREQQIGGRYSFQTFEEYCKERWDITYSRASELIGAASVAENLVNLRCFIPTRESHVLCVVAELEAATLGRESTRLRRARSGEVRSG